MNHFGSIDELWLAAVEDVLENGQRLESRDGGSTELLGWNARLDDPTYNFLLNPCRKLSASYAAAEFIWYMSGERRTDMIEAYAPQYERFTNRDRNGKKYAHGAYGYRFAQGDEYTQIAYVIRHLVKKPNTRQAVLAPWHFEWDLAAIERGDINDIPCTLTLQFILREGKLNCICTMRSNDLWLGTPYDIWCFTCLQQIIAGAIKADVGWYQHNVGSLHIYDRNREKIERCLEPSYSIDRFNYVIPTSGLQSSFMADMVKMEEWGRSHKVIYKDLQEKLGGLNSIYTQLTLMALSKWCGDRAIKLIKCPVMRNHMKKGK